MVSRVLIFGIIKLQKGWYCLLFLILQTFIEQVQDRYFAEIQYEIHRQRNIGLYEQSD